MIEIGQIYESGDERVVTIKMGAGIVGVPVDDNGDVDIFGGNVPASELEAWKHIGSAEEVYNLAGDESEQ